MEQAPVSVIIPAYNVANCVRTCLDSVIGQTAPPREVIVVDDGSTDTTVSAVGEYADRSVRYVVQRNAGPSAARNHGLAAATQPYVAFLDADDYWSPEFLAKTVRFLETRLEAIAVSTGLMIQDVSGAVLRLPEALLLEAANPDGVLLDDFFETWARHDHVRTGSALFRREVVLASGGFRQDLRSAEDLELWGYLATFGPWGFLPATLWVGNPAAGGALNWRQKYRERGRHCVEIEDWERRIRPRLHAEDEAAFAVVRGRVAASYVYARILAGDRKGARRIAERCLDEMPRSRVRGLLRSGLAFGNPGWSTACGIVGLWEDVKSLRLRHGAAGRVARRGAARAATSIVATGGQ
jgi:hypothetical protein